MHQLLFDRGCEGTADKLGDDGNFQSPSALETMSPSYLSFAENTQRNALVELHRRRSSQLYGRTFTNWCFGYTPAVHVDNLFLYVPCYGLNYLSPPIHLLKSNSSARPLTM